MCIFYRERQEVQSCVAGTAASKSEPRNTEALPGSNVNGSLLTTFGIWGQSASQSRVRLCTATPDHSTSLAFAALEPNMMIMVTHHGFIVTTFHE